ncbi:MAG: proline--tRNA ligase [Alphaproteobacteria bacterium]|nr:proline--tRNA ligase [Alphaproteobacteria bacterium]
MTSRKNALPISRSEDFSAWYQAAITGADLAENSSVRGCMVIKPYGYAIWERMQRILDDRFKELGHQNAYFPLFIPLSLFEKEAEHVEGFAKEMAIVTHHRLEKVDGKLKPAGELETPLAVRPTSELVIGESMARWIKSYRDLPVRINQWCNVVRWEMRTRMFLRSSEFLWQEGHTAHETEEEAKTQAREMHEVYNWFISDVLKLYGIPGLKPNHDKFAGAVETYTVETIMQDGKALQAATSHYLGQNFARAVDIRFQSRSGTQEYANTTSWGITTRMIGALVMSHGDDDGINLPSAIAPYHVVIIPLLRSGNEDKLICYCEKIKESLPKGIRSIVDMKDISPQNKKWDYIRKGVPFILEIGLKECDQENVSIIKRASNLEKETCNISEFAANVERLLEQHDKILKDRINELAKNKINNTIKTIDELKEYFRSDTGFVKVKWSGSTDNLSVLDELSLTIRCIPTSQSETKGKCLLSGVDATTDIILAKSY